MSSTPTRVILCQALVAVAATAALPGDVRAQEPLSPVHVTASGKADALDSAAAVHEQQRGDFRRAARLRERAASMRAPSDPKAVTSLWRAGVDRYYADQPAAATGLLEAAAERALAIGDVVGAANALIDAAYVSVDLGQGERMRAYADRGTMLMNSPLLSEDARTALRSRVAQLAPATRALAVAPER